MREEGVYGVTGDEALFMMQLLHKAAPVVSREPRVGALQEGRNHLPAKQAVFSRGRYQVAVLRLWVVTV